MADANLPQSNPNQPTPPKLIKETIQLPTLAKLSSNPDAKKDALKITMPTASMPKKLSQTGAPTPATPPPYATPQQAVPLPEQSPLSAGIQQPAPPVRPKTTTIPTLAKDPTKSVPALSTDIRIGQENQPQAPAPQKTPLQMPVIPSLKPKVASVTEVTQPKIEEVAPLYPPPFATPQPFESTLPSFTPPKPEPLPTPEAPKASFPNFSQESPKPVEEQQPVFSAPKPLEIAPSAPVFSVPQPTTPTPIAEEKSIAPTLPIRPPAPPPPISTVSSAVEEKILPPIANNQPIASQPVIPPQVEETTFSVPTPPAKTKAIAALKKDPQPTSTNVAPTNAPTITLPAETAPTPVEAFKRQVPTQSSDALAMVASVVGLIAVGIMVASLLGKLPVLF